MTSEWMEVSVGDVTIQVTKGTTPTTIGFGFENEGVRFIKVESLSEDGRFLEGKFAYISDEAHNSLLRSQLQEDDVLFTIAGTIGRTAIVDAKYLPANTNQAVAIVRPDKAKVSPRFLRYVLSNRAFTVSAKSKTVQSVQANYSLGELKKARFYLPTLEGQSEILSVLSPIDDRITLLRETNSTLEAIAQALFKSWFVDFDPVRAKAEGREPEGIDAETAALFPDTFEESELGLVPRGWFVSRIGDISTVIDCLHSKKPELIESEFPFLQLSNIRDDGLLATSEVTGVSESDYIKWTSRIEVSGGDCVITNVGRVGAVAQIPEGYKAAMGRNMTAIRLSSEWPYPTYLIELLQSSWMQAEISAKTDVGTILNALNVKSIPQLRCVVADSFVMSAFEGIARPLRNAMEKNLLTIHTLSNLRDTLLPRLISGQLRIADAEAELEKATA